MAGEQTQIPAVSQAKTKTPPKVPLPKEEQKISTVVWLLLASLALFIDVFQIGLDVIGIGLGINAFLDIAVGITLFSFFYWNGIVNTKVTVSLLASFAVDEVTAGAFPAWIADVGYAWLVTDGTAKISQVPVAGKAASTAIRAKMQGPKGGAVTPPPPNANQKVKEDQFSNTLNLRNNSIKEPSTLGGSSSSNLSEGPDRTSPPSTVQSPAVSPSNNPGWKATPIKREGGGEEMSLSA